MKHVIVFIYELYFYNRSTTLTVYLSAVWAATLARRVITPSLERTVKNCSASSSPSNVYVSVPNGACKEQSQKHLLTLECLAKLFLFLMTLFHIRYILIHIYYILESYKTTCICESPSEKLHKMLRELR